MNTRKLFLTIWFLASSISTAYGDDFVNNMVGEPYLQRKDPSAHRSINATVKKVVSDTVFLRTEEKTIRTFGMKEANSDGISSLQTGNKLDLILDRGNSILAVTEAGGKGGFLGNEVTGTVQNFDILNKRIALKTEKGEVQSFDLREAVSTKLNGIGKGRMITLEIDGQNRAMDAYRPE